MKKTRIIIYLLLLSPALKAQQTSIVGTVAVFNSKTETGKRQFIQNAQVEETFGKSQATTTDADGNFRLVLVGIAAKQSFAFTITKTGYEIVNRDNLHAVAGQREAVHILMSPKGKIAESKIKYYQIGKTASEKALDAKIKQKQADLATLKKNEKANQQAINDTQAEIAKLYDYYKTIDQNARELAERFSRVNLDDASELYQRAFRHFQNGSIDSALIVLDEVNWGNKVDSILIEEARLLSLKLVIDFNDSVLVDRRDSLRQAIKLKSQLHLDKKQYNEALNTSELLFALDANDPKALVEDYNQTAWLALFTQNYTLATLYCQNSLDLDKEIVGSRLLQIYAFVLADKKEAAETARAELTRLISKNKLEEWIIRDLNSFEFNGLSATDRLKLRQMFNR
jgi:hypothetical protein